MDAVATLGVAERDRTAGNRDEKSVDIDTWTSLSAARAAASAFLA